MSDSQPLKERRAIALFDRRSGGGRRKVHDLGFFERGGIERRSGIEARLKEERRDQCAKVSPWSSVCPKTKSPVE